MEEKGHLLLERHARHEVVDTLLDWSRGSSYGSSAPLPFKSRYGRPSLVARQQLPRWTTAAPVVKGRPRPRRERPRASAVSAAAPPTLSIGTTHPRSHASSIDVATSTTCAASSAEARCGRPAWIASTRSCEPDATCIARTCRGVGDLLPVTATASDAHRSAELVGVGKRQLTFRAVDQKGRRVVPGGLEGRDERGRTAARELEQRRRVGRRLGREPLPGAGPYLDPTLADERGGEAGRALHRDRGARRSPSGSTAPCPGAGRRRS